MYIPGVFFRPQDLPQLMMPTWYHFLPDSWVQARGPPLSPCGQRTQISSEPRLSCRLRTAQLAHGAGLRSLPTPSQRAKSSPCQSAPAASRPPGSRRGGGRGPCSAHLHELWWSAGFRRRLGRDWGGRRRRRAAREGLHSTCNTKAGSWNTELPRLRKSRDPFCGS